MCQQLILCLFILSTGLIKTNSCSCLSNKRASPFPSLYKKENGAVVVASAWNAGRLWAKETRGDTAFLLLFGVQAGWEVELHRAGTTSHCCPTTAFLQRTEEG